MNIKHTMVAVAALILVCMVVMTADGYDADDVTVTETYAVSVESAGTTQEFATFEEATRYANTVDNSVIKLLDDITLAQKWTISGTVTLDLNGHTLNVPSSSYNISVAASTKLTLVDGSDTGTGSMVGPQVWVDALVDVKGSFVMEGGTIHIPRLDGGNNIRVYNGGSFEMSDGTLTNDGTLAPNGIPSYYIINMVAAGANVTITGGSVGTESTVARGIMVKGDGLTVGTSGAGTGPIVYNIAVGNGNDVSFYSGYISVNAGIFGTDSIFEGVFLNDVTDRLPSGFQCVADGSGFKVEKLDESNSGAYIVNDEGTSFYPSAVTAANALAEGETMVLTRNHVGSMLEFTINDFTLDLNSFSVMNNTGSGYGIWIHPSSTAGEGFVTITSSTPVTVSGSTGIQISSGNSLVDLTLFLENVNPVSTTGGYGLNLETGARIPCGDYVEDLSINGGFIAAMEETPGIVSKYVYGAPGTAAVRDMDSSTMLVTDYHGSINFSSPGSWIVYLDGNTVYSTDEYAIQVSSSDCNLTVVDGTVIGANSGAAVALPYTSMGDDGEEIIPHSNSSLTLENVVLVVEGSNSRDSDPEYGILTNGTCPDMDVTLIDSSVSAPGHGIYHPSTGTVTIIDSEVTGGVTGIEMRAGTLEISGDNTRIQGLGTYNVSSNSSGTTTTGAAVALAPYRGEGSTGLSGEISVTITGGTFVGAVAFSQSNPNEVQSMEVGISIKGGDFQSSGTDENGDTYDAVIVSEDLPDKKVIFGGTFSSDVSTLVPEGIELSDGGTTVTIPFAFDDSVIISMSGILTPSYSTAGDFGITFSIDNSKVATCDPITGMIAWNEGIDDGTQITLTASVSISGGKTMDVSVEIIYVDAGIISSEDNLSVYTSEGMFDSVADRFDEVTGVPSVALDHMRSMVLNISTVDGRGATFSLGTSYFDEGSVIFIIHFGDTVEVATYETYGDSVTYTANDFSPFMITYATASEFAEMQPDMPTIIPDDDDDYDPLPPIIYDDSGSGDDTTTIVACAAAAVVAALIAAFLIIDRRR